MSDMSFLKPLEQMTPQDAAWIRERVCHRKKRHASRQNALLGKAVGGIAYDEAKPYRCPFCDGWHIGRPKGWPIEQPGFLQSVARILGRKG